MMMPALGALILTLTFTQASDLVTETALLPPAPIPQKVIALTFDDGPNPATTPKVLEELEKRHLRATFFVLGECAKNNGSIVKRMTTEGHEVADHSYNHADLTKCSEAGINHQLRQTSEIIEQATGKTPTLMRPPGGQSIKELFDAPKNLD